MNKFLLPFVFWFGSLLGQTEFTSPYTLSNSKVFEDNKQSHMRTIVLDGYIYSFRTDILSRMSISKYDIANKVELYRKDLPGYQHLEALTINQKIYVFEYKWVKETESEQVWVKALNTETGTFETPIKIVEVKGKVKNKFEISASTDYSKILVKYKRHATSKNNDKNFDVYGFIIFNSNFEQLEKIDFTSPYAESKVLLFDYEIKNDGSVYVMQEVLPEDKTKAYSDGLKNSRYEVYNLSKGQVEKTVVEQTQSHRIAYMFLNSKDEILVAGLFSVEPDKEKCDGFYFYNLETQKTSYYRIPIETVNMYENDATENSNRSKFDDKKPIFDDLNYFRIELQKDGGFLLIAQQYDVKVKTSKFNGRTETTSTYFIGDIYVLNISTDKEMIWLSKIPRNQETINTSINTYEYVKSQEGYSFFMFEDVRNLNLNLTERPHEFNDYYGILTEFKLDEKSGTLSLIPIVDMKEVTFDFENKPVKPDYFNIRNLIYINQTGMLELDLNRKKQVMMHFSMTK